MPEAWGLVTVAARLKDSWARGVVVVVGGGVDGVGCRSQEVTTREGEEEEEVDDERRKSDKVNSRHSTEVGAASPARSRKKQKPFRFEERWDGYIRTI